MEKVIPVTNMQASTTEACMFSYNITLQLVKSFFWFHAALQKTSLWGYSDVSS